jgi:release factor glutamine methyltransferase
MLRNDMSITASRLLAEVPDLEVHEARRLLLAAVGRGLDWLIGDPAVAATDAARFRVLAARRLEGEPLQYLEGSVQFGPISLACDPRALIPRPETERLWETAAALLPPERAAVIVDLCTGSGNLALALKHSFPQSRILGVDTSPAALALAQGNAERAGLHVEFIVGDLFAALPSALQGRVDLIVSNPPYVSTGEYSTLPAEVRDYEPVAALVAGPEGTEVLARIAADANTWLCAGGSIACEIGETQSERCLQLFAAYRPRIVLDLAGRPRYIVGSASQPRPVH